MRYAGPRGIALDKFLTWPQHSQDAALSWAGHEGQRCPGRCGRHPADQPRHTHTGVCLECADLAAAEASVRDTPGGHVVWVHGTRADCPTCNPAAR